MSHNLTKVRAVSQNLPKSTIVALLPDSVPEYPIPREAIRVIVVIGGEGAREPSRGGEG